MKKSALFVFFVTSLLVANAQKISGSIKKDASEAASSATIALLKNSDSTILKYAIVKKDGNFELINIAAGIYLLKASHIGYKTLYVPVDFQSTDLLLKPIVLKKEETNLAGVTVSSAKPIIEVKADKTILNVEGTINATGNDGLELLRKSPGVMIDKDDNISLAGKNGVNVYIDGKPSPLSGADLTNYLKSLQSSQMESIEIITNPSAKYDAAGNAGIINIKLKKNKTFGTNGNFNAGFNQGFYPKFNAGLGLNHRNKNINVFGTYNYNNGKSRMQINSRKEQLDTLFVQNNVMNFKNNTHGFKVGADYFLNKKSTIGAVVNGNFSDMEFTTSGPMYFTEISSGTQVKVMNATNDNKMPRNDVNANLNYRFSAGGKEFSVDADYGFYNIKSDQYQPNFYYDGTGTVETNRAIYNMVAPTNIDIATLKSDYEQDFKGGKLGIGGKTSFVKTNNNFKSYNVFTTGNVLDTGKSNKFDYKENINALYVNYARQYKKGFMVQLGLRAENTNLTGTSNGYRWDTNSWEKYDTTFKRNYTGLFPSAAVTFNKNPMKQWTFSYSRRIDRPAYQDLNPFEFRLNEYSYMKGNTDLRPQYTNSFGVTNVYKYKLTTSFNYSHVKDIFARVPDTTDKTKGFLTKKNLATQDIFALNISYPFQYKKYSFFATLNSNYAHYQADFGGGDRNIDLKVFALTYYMQNSFKFGKGWTGELSGLYISPSVWQGTIKSDAMGMVDVGLQKTILKNTGNIKLVVSDIFKTMKWGGKSDFAGVSSTFNGHGELTQVKLNFSYRFGNSQVKAARQRKSAIEDENKRTQQSGGQMGGN
ncbi:MAG: TonB-dependent receptor [Chitinophagaceae bacterium]|nr:TonB-dependent receptor [Chitinophagaceae bacterium]